MLVLALLVFVVVGCGFLVAIAVVVVVKPHDLHNEVAQQATEVLVLFSARTYCKRARRRPASVPHFSCVRSRHYRPPY